MAFLSLALLTGACAAGGNADLEEQAATAALLAEEELAEEERAAAARREGDTVLPSGVTLHYVEQGRRSGDVVIFLHGYTDSHRAFDRNLPIFPRRYRVFALDQRGHGRSSQPACCYAQSDFAADVVQFMDAHGIERATLVGHSMGSFIARQVALEYPDRVDALVLAGSAPTAAGNEVVLGLQEAVNALTDPIDPDFVYGFQASTFYRPVPASFLETAVSESLRLPAALWQRVLAGLVEEDHTGQLGQITAPTLVLFGDQDGIFSLAEQEALVSAMPNAELIVYRETGHGLQAELPHRFTRDILSFLRRR